MKKRDYEQLNKKYEEYQNKFDEYNEKMHLMASKMREIEAQLNKDFIYKEFTYKDFKCIVKYIEINHKSLIALDKEDNRKLYIFINNKLSEHDAELEVNYVINNMLPGVVDKILNQEQLEKKKHDEEIKQLEFRGLDFKTIKNIIFNPDKKISTTEINILSKIVSNILDTEELNSTLLMVGFLAFDLGVMEGKREERAKRKRVVVID